MQNNKNPKNIAVTIFLFGMLGIIFFTLWYTSTPHKDSKNKESVTNTQQEEIDALKKQVENLKEKDIKTVSIQQNNTSTNDFELQATCAKHARDSFVEWEYNKSTSSYTSHFNKERTRCFMLVTYRTNISILYSIYDAISGEEYANYWYPYNTEESVPLLVGCPYDQKLTVQNCENAIKREAQYSEWKELSNLYMNN